MKNIVILFLALIFLSSPQKRVQEKCQLQNCPQPYCVPSAPCQNDTKWDRYQCKCLPISNLQLLELELENNKCQLPIQGCPKGKILNRQTCECLCKLQLGQCLLPKTWNPETCSCQCQNRILTTCPVDYPFNDQTCKCHTSCPPPANGCSQPKIWNNSTCQCQCSNKDDCPSEWIFDPECKCVKQYCSPPFVPCQQNKKWDPYQCRCVTIKKCPIKDCPDEKQWNFETCQCECKDRDIIKCLGFNQQSCKCNCLPPKKGCPIGKRWNAQRCLCQKRWIGPLDCILPKQWNKDINSCDCLSRYYSKCGNGYNEDTCSCNRCLLPKQWDSRTGSCECLNRYYVKCAYGYNNEKCQCQSSPIRGNLIHHP